MLGGGSTAGLGDLVDMYEEQLNPSDEFQYRFNNQWLNFSVFESCSLEDQGRFATSGFEYIPTYTASGAPILDLAKYRNLPRSYMFGLTIDL